MRHMTDIMAMVRGGRLQEATAAIQGSLGGAAAGPVLRTAEPAMRDVTPRPIGLPGPATPGAPPRRPRAEARPRRPAAPRPPRAPGAVPEGGLWERHDFDGLPARLFVPAEADEAAPLLVMLHGCTQTPEDFALGTGMCHAAGAVGAHVLWPEQTRAHNPNGCWSWFEPAHQGRGGEAGAIAGAARAVAARIGTGAAGIHVAGLSAGGAMAAILGAEHADLVASVGIHSGLAPGSARDVASAFAAMRGGAAGRATLRVPAIVFHGDADRTVVPANARALAGGTLRARPRRIAEGGRTCRVTEVAATAGGAALELWEVEGLGHAWSGGDAAGSHADPLGPDATAEMLRFFGAHPKG